MIVIETKLLQTEGIEEEDESLLSLLLQRNLVYNVKTIHIYIEVIIITDKSDGFV